MITARARPPRSRTTLWIIVNAYEDDRYYRGRSARPHAGHGRSPPQFQDVMLEPQADCPAAQVANRQIVGAYDNPHALAELADACDIVTYEFENVPSMPPRRWRPRGRSIRRHGRLKSRRPADGKGIPRLLRYPDRAVPPYRQPGRSGRSPCRIRRGRCAQDAPHGL